MRVSVFLALLLTAAMPSKFLQAQTDLKSEVSLATVNKPAAKPGNRLPHKIIYPGDHFYSALLAQSGVQGEVKLELELASDGKVLVAKVLGSSQSAELDNNALAYVNGDSWTLPENSLQDSASIYTLSIIFLKDSVLTISTKTCADFNTDLNYFQSIRPNADASDLSALQLIAGIFTVQLMKDQGASETLKYVKSIKTINKDSIKACTEKPAELLIKTYVKSANQNGIKF